MANVREIESAAADWLSRRDSGQWSEADEQALRQWLANIDNFVEFARLEAVWQQANRLKALEGTLSPSAWQDPSELADESSVTPARLPPAAASSKRGVRQRAASWGLAAMVLIAVAIAFWRPEFAQDSHTTPVGGLASIPMQDGSTVLLNTDSRLRISDSEAERRIDLARGEAFFDVAADATRPFVVIAGRQRVLALGTKFSVRRLPGDELSVAVIEGRVRVESADAAEGGAPLAVLGAGEVATSGDDGVLVEKLAIRDIEAHLSWRSGFLSFRETPLRLAAEEFNRYNVLKIAIEDPSIADVRIGGRFRSTNVDAFVRLLEHDFAIRVDRYGDRITLRERGS